MSYGVLNIYRAVAIKKYFFWKSNKKKVNNSDGWHRNSINKVEDSYTVSTDIKNTSVTVSTALNSALDWHTLVDAGDRHTRTRIHRYTHTHRALFYFNQCIWHYWHREESTSSLCCHIMAPLWSSISSHILHRHGAAVVPCTSMKWKHPGQTVLGGQRDT